MTDHLQDACVLREDGVYGRVVTISKGEQGADMVVVRFDDGAQVAVAPGMLAADNNGVHRLLLATARPAPTDAVVIPVVAEELLLSRQTVPTGIVRVHKRVETVEEVVDTPLTVEEVVVERVPVNTFVQDAPQVREEDGVVIIPVLEEVLVVEKRLLLREEVRLTRRSKTTAAPQTIALRREVVEIERAGPEGLQEEDPNPNGEPRTGMDPAAPLSPRD